ncbi:MAG: hypothetical protein RQ754_02940 [Desulfuromonadales bacterium]|nr:hypothetical protein [Desulfuromonadales bacterium]
MTNLKEYTAFDCEECPLSDCYPANPMCPVLRRELQEKGLPLPEIRELMQEAPQVGRPKKIQAAPENYQDRQDYLKKYKRNYRRVSLRGVKLRKMDIEILEAHFECHGGGFEEEISTLLEFWAQLIREKRKGS